MGWPRAGTASAANSIITILFFIGFIFLSGEKPIASHEGQLMFDCLGLYPETARPGSRKTIVH
jgi:hypothetical protein